MSSWQIIIWTVLIILSVYVLDDVKEDCPHCGSIEAVSVTRSRMYWHYKCWNCNHRWLEDL